MKPSKNESDSPARDSRVPKSGSGQHGPALIEPSPVHGKAKGAAAGGNASPNGPAASMFPESTKAIEKGIFDALCEAFF